MAENGVTRRGVMRSGAGVVAAGTLAAPMVHAQGTGGTIRVAFWDHWVPGGNDALKQLSAKWGEQNRVNVQLDFINTTGNQLQLTAAAQAQSRQGHDAISLTPWDVGAYADQLEPVDDVIQRLVAKYGPINPIAEYLGKHGGKWRGVPATSGTQAKPACVRLDLLEQHAGIDVRAMWPAENKRGPNADQWTWDTFLKAAEACHKAGVPFGLPMGQFSDAVDWIGALFLSYGAQITDDKGNPTIRGNANLRQAVDYAVRLSKFLPGDVWAWDDASNNRALISGRSALVFNPPSAWAVAKRDAPQVAEKCWTVPMPAGPAGRFLAYLPYTTGIWAFGRNKNAAKQLLEFLGQRDSAELTTNTSGGYDIPPFASMADFKIWETQNPPTGTIFNYPLKDHHQAKYAVAYSPAPPELASQMYIQALNTKVIARVAQGGESLDSALGWLEREINNMRRG
ncbi:ABC transporter substrate-binding protein [Paracraurococcus ruber]|uniref:ABC transporter substrate-binding protein n=1 Tax=Paracraurococcus ruber TaxID=77675 RepID=A0ABS1CZ57_9PROT|nr:ABC transporter substrate-binding protein [Paracraurococcus ruber]MBK1659820.1 ABC transporter substrate-binding protein [Paracraurococcus ruber]TDG31438.1 carbohydrate ABC transporter substrate-binding protein [Paracraurococcus ruber]